MPQILFDFHHHHALLLSRFREGGGIPLPLLLRHQPPPPLAHHHLPKLLSWRWWSSPSRGGCAVWSSWCALQRKFLRQFFEIWNGNEGYFFGVEPRLYICCFSSAKPSSLHFMFFFCWLWQKFMADDAYITWFIIKRERLLSEWEPKKRRWVEYYTIRP